MEEEKIDVFLNEYHSKYGEMADYLSAPKELPTKLKDSSSVSFIFNETIGIETQTYMKELANSEEEFDYDCKILTQIDFCLRNKQNVAVSGYGSKMKLVESFIKYHLNEEFPILIFYGYSSTISLNGILCAIEKFIFEWRKAVGKIEIEPEKNVKSNKLDHVMENLKRMANLETLYIVIHNIDGKNIMDEHTQQTLSELASLDKIRMLVTFDNVKYLATMTSKTRKGFNFGLLHYNTYHVYQRELGFEENLITSKEDKKVKALTYILKSLSPNQKFQNIYKMNLLFFREIIELIAKFLLENQEEPEITHKQLFEECVEAMIISNETQLKENLVELLDHKVLREKKGEGGKVLYTMDYPVNVLNKIANKQILEEVH